MDIHHSQVDSRTSGQPRATSQRPLGWGGLALEGVVLDADGITCSGPEICTARTKGGDPWICLWLPANNSNGPRVRTSHTFPLICVGVKCQTRSERKLIKTGLCECDDQIWSMRVRRSKLVYASATIRTGLREYDDHNWSMRVRRLKLVYASTTIETGLCDSDDQNWSMPVRRSKTGLRKIIFG